MNTGNSKRFSVIELDPRMKLLIVAIFTTTSYIAPNIFALVWMYIVVVGLYLIFHLWKSVRKLSAFFISFLILEYILNLFPKNGIVATVGLVLFMIERVAVFFAMGVWMGARLRVSDFVTAMQNMHFPKGGTITLAVVFRYIPTVQVEFISIKNTMALRGIGLNFRNIIIHPLKTVEYMIVPLIIRSMTVADELAASAMTRGLDLNTKRTSYREVRLKFSDIFVTLIIVAIAICGIVLSNTMWKGGP